MNVQKVKKIAVIGAGTMGRGIAHMACTGGFATTLQDVSEEILKFAKATIQENLEKAVERKLIGEEAAKDALLRLITTTNLESAVKEADLVIEAIPELIEAKLDLFAKIDKVCKPEILGMHFFNPVHKMKLVEIVRGLETSAETIETIKTVAEQMGKETVTSKSRQDSSPAASTH
jgi:3-hydroxybutyryl-CoA dehydrogenase